MDVIKNLAILIQEANRIVCLTGAGMSTESGIIDFRSNNGLWNDENSIKDLMKIGYFESHPDNFWKAYREIFRVHSAEKYKPNSGHIFLSQLEQMGKNVTIITQNIDGLHQKAGNTHVLEMHGSIHHYSCLSCHKEYPLSFIRKNKIPKCSDCHSILKPDTVLFDEMVRHYDEAESILLKADLFITLGSSLKVSPANSLPVTFKEAFYKENKNAKLVIINRDKTPLDHCFDLIINQKIGKTLDEVKKYLISQI